MTVQDAINQVYLIATGKNTTLTLTDAHGAKILSYLNHYSAEFAKRDWRNMRSTFTLTPLVSATDTYNFADLTTLHHPSRQLGDFVRIYHSDGVGETDYTLVPIDRLYESGTIRNNAGARLVAISGTNLVFDAPFVSGNPQYGGSIKMPGYLVPNTLASVADTIQVSDPLWLVQKSASQYVLTDRTRVQLFDQINAEAQRLWGEMMADEDTQQETVYTEPIFPHSGGAFS